MALHKVAVAAKDGAGTTIPGGIQQHDTSGTGAGPNDPLLVLIDSSGAEILGTTADAAATQTDTTALSGMSVWKQISKSIQAAAASLAGTLTVATHAVTQSGLWVLSAGSAIVGKVGIDQTTPGTTNGVVVNNANANGAAATAASAPVNMATDQATIAIANDVSQLMNGKSGVALTPLKAKVSITTATTTTVIALVATKKIRVLSMYLVCSAADTVNLQSHTTTSNSDGLPSYAANGGIVLPFNPLGWFDTTSGEALDIVTSASGQVSGVITYVAF